jgi:hypothetical protein
MNALYRVGLLVLFFTNLVVAQQPLFRAVDIDVGATEQVQLSDGKRATVKLLSISETRDKARSAIREALAESGDQWLPCDPFLRKLPSPGDDG